ncbi:MAG: tail fiber domain-containing protein [Bacteroidota bacterium]
MFATLLLFCMAGAPPVFAQLEIDQDGKGAIGAAPKTGYQFFSYMSTNSSTSNFALGAEARNAAEKNTALWAKAVGGSDLAMGIYASAGDSPLKNVGLSARAAGTGASTNYAVEVYAVGGLNARGYHSSAENATNDNIGIWGNGQSGTRAIGLRGRGKNASQNNYGAWVNAEGGTNAYGLFATGNAGSASGNNYAVFGQMLGTPTGNDFAGYFQGDVNVTGTIFGTLNTPSDGQLKERIRDLSSEQVTALLSQLRPRSYHYRSDQPGMHLPQGERMGFVAQEMEELLPHLVESATQSAVYGEDGEVLHEAVTYKSLNYVELIPLLVAALQEQQANIDALKETLERNGLSVGE